MGLDPKQRARLDEKVPPLVGINQKMERSVKNNSCICERPSTAVYCKKCLEYFWGRLLNFCKEHPNKRYLMDITSCPNCKKYQDLVEVPNCSYPDFLKLTKMDVE